VDRSCGNQEPIVKSRREKKKPNLIYFQPEELRVFLLLRKEVKDGI